MANEEHLKILSQGVVAWNEWREQNRDVLPDLSGANLSGASLSEADLSEADLSGANLRKAALIKANLWAANLSGAKLGGAALIKANLWATNLSGANLSRANLSEAHLWVADLRWADLSKADLSGAHLSGANLFGADLREADLHGADLSEANLRKADLSGAHLSGATLFGANLRGADLSGAALNMARLVETNLTGATLKGCRVFGISAWGVKLDGAKQSDLVITREGEPVITVDNLEVAQFIYLLLHNERIRHVIDTITSKVVLILGRFTDERKPALDAIREALRRQDRLPVMFDFTPPTSRDLTETVSTLAHMARYVIADITDPRSIPQELERIVPHLPSVPIQPLLQGDSTEYGMFEHFKAYPWVLAVHRYRDLDDLLASLEEKVIIPAEKKSQQLQDERSRRP